VSSSSSSEKEVKAHDDFEEVEIDEDSDEEEAMPVSEPDEKCSVGYSPCARRRGMRWYVTMPWCTTQHSWS
jgi:hypothetical protein